MAGNHAADQGRRNFLQLDGGDLVKWVGEAGPGWPAPSCCRERSSCWRSTGSAIGGWPRSPSARAAPTVCRSPVTIRRPSPAGGLIRAIEFEPVHVGGLAFGKRLLPGTPPASEHTPEEIRQIAGGLR